MQPHAEAAREFHNGLFCSSQLLSSQQPMDSQYTASKNFKAPSEAHLGQIDQILSKSCFSFVFDRGDINTTENSNQGS